MRAGARRLRPGVLAVFTAVLGLAGAAAAPPVTAQPPPARLMSWRDLLGRPKPTLRPERIRYGDDANQIIDLWRPTTPGPHPVIAMIHGGCWQASVASFHIMDWAAADLARRGVAVWNIEYRRADQPGGGDFGTYTDVLSALVKLRKEASDRKLASGRGVIVLGHSAGGHLALWSAGLRSTIERNISGPQPRDRKDMPPKVRAVIDLAGIADLEHDTATACGPEVVAQMAGSPPSYGSTSPAHMLPLKADLFVIHGAQDTTVEPAVGARFAAKARAAGDRVTVLTPPGGHVEEIAPGSEAWEKTIAPLVLKLTGVAK